MAQFLGPAQGYSIRFLGENKYYLGSTNKGQSGYFVADVYKQDPPLNSGIGFTLINAAGGRLLALDELCDPLAGFLRPSITGL